MHAFEIDVAVQCPDETLVRDNKKKGKREKSSRKTKDENEWNEKRKENKLDFLNA